LLGITCLLGKPAEGLGKGGRGPASQLNYSMSFLPLAVLFPDSGFGVPLALVLAALILIAAEFFLPGAIVGTIGAVIGLVGLAMAASHGLTEFLVLATIFVLGVAGEILLFRRLVPNMAKRLGIANPTADTGSAVPGAGSFAALVGREGTTLTALAPTGMVEVAGRRVEATSADGFLDKGTAVTVSDTNPGGIVVRRSL
jgi:membrane-bound serine protease (ClpP class)